MDRRRLERRVAAARIVEAAGAAAAVARFARSMADNLAAAARVDNTKNEAKRSKRENFGVSLPVNMPDIGRAVAAAAHRRIAEAAVARNSRVVAARTQQPDCEAAAAVAAEVAAAAQRRAVAPVN